jgi:hypothetical protein
MLAFFDAVGYAANPTPLRNPFGVKALTVEKWTGRVFWSGSFG